LLIYAQSARLAVRQPLTIRRLACTRTAFHSTKGLLPFAATTMTGEKEIAVTKIVILARVGAWLTVQSIIVLSVVPGKMRPDVFGNDYAEHFAAYFIAGTLFAIGYRRPMRWLSSGLLLTMCAGSLEFVQLWIPGRIASASDFAAGTLGAWIGLLLIVTAKRAQEYILVVSYDEPGDCAHPR
jgi:hypothetical protein